MTTATSRGKRLPQFTRLKSDHITEGGQELTQGRDLAAGTKTEVMEACSPWLAQPLSYTIQDHLPRVGTAYRKLGLLPSIINQENVKSAKFNQGLSQVWFPHLR